METDWEPVELLGSRGDVVRGGASGDDTGLRVLHPMGAYDAEGEVTRLWTGRAVSVR